MKYTNQSNIFIYLIWFHISFSQYINMDTGLDV